MFSNKLQHAREASMIQSMILSQQRERKPEAQNHTRTETKVIAWIGKTRASSSPGFAYSVPAK
jgi:protein subunit release factor B